MFFDVQGDFFSVEFIHYEFFFHLNTEKKTVCDNFCQF